MKAMDGQVDVYEAIRDLAGEANDQAKRAADRIIDEAAGTGEPFSANDLRGRFEVAQVPRPLIGGRFMYALHRLHTIERAGTVASTDKGTHGKPVGLYRGTEARLARLDPEEVIANG